ncbi:MAG: HAMP domain-containing histidine kinase [Rhodospirillaceae bacterium]|nr:MAG: HAMP domain-containing histidine kinase [Rhodospirillaceae bacterium]
MSTANDPQRPPDHQPDSLSETTRQGRLGGSNPNRRAVRPRRVLTGLSARALGLAVMFVLLAEAVLFVPSVGRWLEQELNDRLSDGHLAIRTLEELPSAMPNDRLTRELLDHVDAGLVAFRAPDRPKLALFQELGLQVDRSVDLRDTGLLRLSIIAFQIIFDHRPAATLRVVGLSPVDPNAEIELLLDQTRICRELRSYAARIAAFSLFISLVTGLLLYLALGWLIVRPVLRLSRAMRAFAKHPEIEQPGLQEAGRADEIGDAFTQMKAMQDTVRSALTQNRRLASLGTGVAKISHDLRNLLTTSLLITDRMSASKDEGVSRAAPRLAESIERAATLTHTIVQHVRDGLPALAVELVVLKPFFGGVIDRIRQRWGPQGKVVSLLEDFDITSLHFDPLQVERVLINLLDNSFEAGADQVDLRAEARESGLVICVQDNGAGVPDAAVPHLFDAFKGSTKRSGTGLGLHNAAEIVEAHGGRLRLVHTGQDGAELTTFEIQLPAVTPGPVGATTT